MYKAEILATLAKNPSTLKATLKDIYDNGNCASIVEEALASNPNTPLAILKDIAERNMRS